jgi:hypothetical protein
MTDHVPSPSMKVVEVPSDPGTIKSHELLSLRKLQFRRSDHSFLCAVSASLSSLLRAMLLNVPANEPVGVIHWVPDQTRSVHTVHISTFVSNPDDNVW